MTDFVLNYDITTRREIQIVDMASSAKTTFLGKIFQIQTRFMQPYKVYMEFDLKKIILDIIKFNIIKERGVTELLFFNEFHLNI